MMHYHRHPPHFFYQRYRSCQLALVILCVFLCAHQTKSQNVQLHTPTLFVQNFDPNVSFRTNVCKQHEKYYRREIELKDGLQNMTLHPSIGNWGGEFFSLNTETGAIDDENDPGMIVKMMDELARRAGFSWRNSFGVYETPEDGKSWSDFAIWLSDTYDFSADYWFRSHDRLRSGIGFFPAWYDGSYIMVAEETITQSADFFSWLKPFDYRVWIMTLLTCILSGVVYSGVTELADKSLQSHISNPTHHFFLPALAVAGNFEFDPLSIPSMITGSIAFFSLVLISSYTAKLATHFVVINKPSLGITTIDDAVRGNLPICVWKGTALEDHLRTRFPTYRYIRTYADGVDMFKDAQGEGKMCSIALTSVSSWNSYQNQRDVNRDCKLSWVGRVVQPTESAFITKADSGIKCTSFMRDVLTYHFEEMIFDGFIDELWKEHYASVHDQECKSSAVSSQNKDTKGGSQKVTLAGLGGPFLLHLLITTIATIIAILPVLRGDKVQKQQSTTEQAPPPQQDEGSSLSFSMHLEDVQQASGREEERRRQQQGNNDYDDDGREVSVHSSESPHIELKSLFVGEQNNIEMKSLFVGEQNVDYNNDGQQEINMYPSITHPRRNSLLASAGEFVMDHLPEIRRQSMSSIARFSVTNNDHPTSRYHPTTGEQQPRRNSMLSSFGASGATTATQQPRRSSMLSSSSSPFGTATNYNTSARPRRNSMFSSVAAAATTSPSTNDPSEMKTLLDDKKQHLC